MSPLYPILEISSLTPDDILSFTSYFKDESGTCCLHSSSRGNASTRSVLGLLPYQIATVRGNVLELKKGSLVTQESVIDPWKSLQEHFFSKLAKKNQFAFGWFGYGMTLFSANQTAQKTPSKYPDAYWQLCTLVLDYNHKTRSATIWFDPEGENYLQKNQLSLLSELKSKKGWLQKRLPKPVEGDLPFGKYFFSFESKSETYQKKVETIQDLIREGKVYQVNLTERFTFKTEKDPFSLFKHLTQTHPVPFSSFFKTDDLTVVSASPERFLSLKNGKLETRPIKGTWARGKTAEEDAVNKSLLESSKKELAELLMITDLMRNDLGKISEPGSVHVKELRTCQTYSNVFHLLSVIESKPKKMPLIELVASCFPPGSVSGCPKFTAVETICELENHTRELYTGCLGYFRNEDEFDLCVTIRTALFDHFQCQLGLGSGIVIDSIPLNEFTEVLQKGKPFFEYFTPEEES